MGHGENGVWVTDGGNEAVTLSDLPNIIKVVP